MKSTPALKWSAAIAMILDSAHSLSSATMKTDDMPITEDGVFWKRFLDDATGGGGGSMPPMDPSIEGGEPTCEDLSGVDFGECEALVGAGIVGGECAMISGCGDQGFRLFAELRDCRMLCEVPTELESALAVWRSVGTDDYVYVYDPDCSACIPLYSSPRTARVWGDEVTFVRFADDELNFEDVPPRLFDETPTIMDLFDKIQDAIDGDAFVVRVEYNETYGYPQEIYIDYDGNKEEVERYSTMLIEAVENPQKALDVAKANWKSYGMPDHYDYTFQRICFCPVERTQPMVVHVKNNGINAVSSADTGVLVSNDSSFDVPTIEELFQMIQNAIDQNYFIVEATYDNVTGMPTTIYIDEDFRIADEEVAIYASELREPHTSPCNNEFCESDEFCCNPSCSICAPIDGGRCVKLFCTPPERSP